mmetsp:Transcript_6437/g.11225  ORF Transcript_6437/g.11225 Transcript_6437/m.11225 type:complete len:241 (-) Transcript_6437:1798-2520(-)
MRSLLALCIIGTVFAADISECITNLTQGLVSGDCAKLIVSKALSSAIIAGALGVKLPQIIKIYRAKSVEGISETSFYIEVLSLAFVSAYYYHQRQPLSTYGESVIILVQGIAQIILLWTYSKASSFRILTVSTLFIAICAPLFLELIPAHLWEWTMVSVMVLNVSFRTSQIVETFRSKTTGQLSFVTAFLNFLGVVARVFTTLVENDDPLLLANIVSVALLNGVIVLQFHVYWGGKAKTQ